jgi:hypothetical protein
MDQVNKFQKCILEVLRNHSHSSSCGESEIQHVIDVKNNHYLLVHAGWNRKIRQYGCIIHMDIKNDKIWIQHDGTEIGVANELVEMGISKDNIVLGYQHTNRRKYSGFAIY